MGIFKKAFSLTVITALLLSVLSLTGCKDKNLFGKTTLRCAYWGDVKEVEIINNSVKRFKEKNPGIDVKLEKLPAGDPYTEKMLTQIAGGNPPDVMFINAERFIIFAAKDIFLPLDDYIAKDKFPLENYYSEIVDKYSLNGKVYALPRDIAPVCVVYFNRNLFESAGVKFPDNNWTWNDLLDKAKKLTIKNSDGTTTYGFADDWPIWEAWVLSNGAKYVDDIKNPKKCLLDSKEALDGIRFRQNLVHKYKVAPSPANMSAMGGVGASDLFMQGKAAMFFSGIWKAPFFREITAFKWDAVMFPKNNSGKRGFNLSGAGYAALKTTKHPEESWKLITFLSGEDGQRELAETGLAQPAIKNIANSPAFLDGKPPAGKKFLLDAVQYGTFEPDMTAWQEAKSKFLYPALDKVWNGDNKPEEVIPAAVAEINKDYFNIK